MPPTSNFSLRLWEAARTDQTGSIWFNPDGDGFYIDPAKFHQNYLAAGWMRSGRYSSFVRQLNFYRFRQEHNGNPRGPVKLYRNDNFRADRADLLVNIKRMAFTTGRRRGPQKGKNENVPPPPNLQARPDIVQPNWMRNYPARPAFNPQLSGFRPQLSGGFDQQLAGFNQGMAGFQVNNGGLNQQRSGFDQQMSGFQPGMSGQPEMSAIKQDKSGFHPAGFQPGMSGFHPGMSGFQPGFNYGPPPAYQHTPMAQMQNFASMPGCSSSIPPPNYAAKQVKVEPIDNQQGGQYGDVVNLTQLNAQMPSNPVLDEIIQIYPEFFN